jgi:hypothetical protein
MHNWADPSAWEKSKNKKIQSKWVSEREREKVITREVALWEIHRVWSSLHCALDCIIISSLFQQTIINVYAMLCNFKYEYEYEREEEEEEEKKVKKRNYLIELNTWKKAHSCTTRSQSITLNCINQWSICCWVSDQKMPMPLWPLGMFVKKIAMEVARGGNDHVYTRFKLLS